MLALCSESPVGKWGKHEDSTTLRQWRRPEAAELAFEKVREGNRCGVLKVRSDDLHADWQPDGEREMGTAVEGTPQNVADLISKADAITQDRTRYFSGTLCWHHIVERSVGNNAYSGRTIWKHVSPRIGARLLRLRHALQRCFYQPGLRPSLAQRVETTQSR